MTRRHRAARPDGAVSIRLAGQASDETLRRISHRPMNISPLLPLVLFAPAAARAANPPVPLAITEAMSNSSHLGKDLNGDWFEIVNTGTVPLDLDGYSWDDNHEDPDYAKFPAVTLAPGEFLLVLDENNAEEAQGFRDAWGLPSTLKILTREDFGVFSPDELRGLGNDDKVIIFNPDGSELTSVSYPAYQTGYSFAWFTDGNPVPGLFSLNGQYGAITSDQDPADVASPGTASPGLYRIWVDSKGLAGANSQPAADPDDDGRTNFTEYLFGGNPAKADAAPPQSVAVADGTVEWTFARRSDDLSLVFTVQTSIDLADWETRPFAPTTEVPHPTLAGHVLSTFRFPVGEARFFRVGGE